MSFPDQAGFEKWAKGQGMEVIHSPCDPMWTYSYKETEYAWRGWANCPAKPDDALIAAVRALVDKLPRDGKPFSSFYARDELLAVRILLDKPEDRVPPLDLPGSPVDGCRMTAS